MSRPLHVRTHPSLDVDGCFGCRIASVSMARGVLRTLAEKERQVRLAQYKRARDEGSKPRGTGRQGFADREDYPTQALRHSDNLGRPYRADDMVGTFYPEIKEAIAPIDMDATFGASEATT